VCQEWLGSPGFAHGPEKINKTGWLADKNGLFLAAPAAIHLSVLAVVVEKVPSVTKKSTGQPAHRAQGEGAGCVFWSYCADNRHLKPPRRSLARSGPLWWCAHNLLLLPVIVALPGAA
jgi:hypothetical protein